MFGGSLDEDLITVTEIHDEIIQSTGGVKGYHDVNMVKSALARPLQSAFGVDAYQNEFEKAAALLFSLANNHGFRDGNKRTAMAATIYYLHILNIEISITNDEYESFMLHIVSQKPSIQEITEWLQDHSG